MINTIIFDLGGVLIDWNPLYLYRKLFITEAESVAFLEDICTPDWNEEQDGGRTIAAANEYLIQRFPGHEANIRAFYARYPEMLGGPITGTVEILKHLKESKNYGLYALTNWSAETFPVAQAQFDFLSWFDGIVVSGTEKDRKPFPSFYKILFDRYQVNPAEALFIDDNQRNVDAAEKIGLRAIYFTSPPELREDLKKMGILI